MRITFSLEKGDVNPYAAKSNWGMSPSAELLDNKKQEIQFGNALTVTFGSKLFDVLGAIQSAKEEYASDNWDGYGANALDDYSANQAITFAQLMPTNLPVPEVSVDTRGNIEFEWFKGPRNVLSISISGTGDLIYAGLMGADKMYGVVHAYDYIPNKIIDNIPSGLLT